jgi:hypothetical protein
VGWDRQKRGGATRLGRPGRRGQGDEDEDDDEDAEDMATRPGCMAAGEQERGRRPTDTGGSSGSVAYQRSTSVAIATELCLAMELHLAIELRPSSYLREPVSSLRTCSRCQYSQGPSWSPAPELHRWPNYIKNFVVGPYQVLRFFHLLCHAAFCKRRAVTVK